MERLDIGKDYTFSVVSMKLNPMTAHGLFELNKILKWFTKVARLVIFDFL